MDLRSCQGGGGQVISAVAHVLATLLVLLPTWGILHTLWGWFLNRPAPLTVEQKSTICGASTIILVFFAGVLAALLW